MTEKNKGLIGYFGLYDWWINSFTSSERGYIMYLYDNMPILGDRTPLVSGSLYKTSQTPINFIHNLLALPDPKNDISLIERIIKKGEEIGETGRHIIDLHLFYSTCGTIYYKLRDLDESYYEKAKEFFLKQISINETVFKAMKKEFGTERVPSHKGFKQMAIIYEKEKRFTDAINLCNAALKTGWRGDWIARIEKLEAKLNKG